MESDFNVSGYRALANAVIAQAVEDYRGALVGYHKCLINKKEEPAVTKHYEGRIKYFEDWFSSQYFELLSGVDGKRFARLIRDELKQFNYDLSALKKSRKEETEKRNRK